MPLTRGAGECLDDPVVDGPFRWLCRRGNAKPREAGLMLPDQEDWRGIGSCDPRELRPINLKGFFRQPMVGPRFLGEESGFESLRKSMADYLKAVRDIASRDGKCGKTSGIIVNGNPVTCELPESKKHNKHEAMDGHISWTSDNGTNYIDAARITG